jgi:hypothetical protein
MGKPYSMDLRERVVAAVDPGGLSCKVRKESFVANVRGYLPSNRIPERLAER